MTDVVSRERYEELVRQLDEAHETVGYVLSNELEIKAKDTRGDIDEIRVVQVEIRDDLLDALIPCLPWSEINKRAAMIGIGIAILKALVKSRTNPGADLYQRSPSGIWRKLLLWLLRKSYSDGTTVEVRIRAPRDEEPNPYKDLVFTP